ncbi:MAG: alpha/beta hydrolase [Candidatus Dormibacteraeota bacterium]|nr:alpha/beta hydrolase [Candidatus Dormibacteraeota bacterium]
MLELPDARIAYDTVGSGPLIVFLHGVGSNRQTWQPQLREFSATHTAVAIDARGYGGSSTAPNTVSMARFAADTAAVIKAVGHGSAHVCGLSMGGIVALHLWRDHPHLVLSLLLADSWAWHPSAAAGQDGRLAAIDASEMASLARVRMPAVYGPGADPQLVRLGVERFASLDKSVYRAATAELWGVDMRGVARTVTVPTLVLVGEHDSIAPPQLSRELAGLISGAQLVVIPAAGHLTNEENPAAFNQAVGGFLRAWSERTMHG